jgi:hypothetical protein
MVLKPSELALVQPSRQFPGPRQHQTTEFVTHQPNRRQQTCMVHQEVDDEDLHFAPDWSDLARGWRAANVVAALSVNNACVARGSLRSITSA